MRTFASVLYYRLVRNLRDRLYIAEIVLYPLVLILVLGSALGSAFEPRDIPPVPVAVPAVQDDALSRALHEFFLRDDVREYLSPIEAASLEEAEDLLTSHDAVSAVYIVRGSGNAQVVLLERSDVPLQSGIVRAVVGNFVRGANVVSVLQTYGVEDAQYKPMGYLLQEQEFSIAGRVPRAFDFYSISMLVMTVMFAAAFSADGMKEILQDATGRRIRSAVYRRFPYVMGTMTAYWVTTVLQAFTVISITAVIFQVPWFARPLHLLAVAASLSLFAVALGALVFTLLNDTQKSQNVIRAVVLGSLFLSGGAFRLGPPGPMLSALRQVLPNHHGQTALLEMMFGSNPDASFAVSAGFAAAGTALLGFTMVMLYVRRSEV